MTFSEILFEVSDRIATVTLNRPDRLNAWTPTMGLEVREAMEQARSDDAVRAIVLTGAGRGFCAGYDMDALGETSAAGEVEVPDFVPVGEQDREDFQHPMTWLPAIDKPVIAAVNGPAAGIGLALLLFCDLRFAAAGAKFVTAFSRRGLVAEHGTSWMLTRLVGHSRSLDLLLSSRAVMGEEAFRIGLVDRVFDGADLMAETRAYARDLADNVSPRSTRIIKRQVWNALFESLADSMREADSEMALSLKSADFREGVAHFVEKRPANFDGNGR
jgi:enoyl-CoA hydratase/carnithine racemase